MYQTGTHGSVGGRLANEWSASYPIPAAGTLGTLHGGGVFPPEGHGDLCQLPLAVDVVIVHIGQTSGAFVAGAQQTQGLLYDPAAFFLCGVLNQVALHLTSPGSPAPGR